MSVRSITSLVKKNFVNSLPYIWYLSHFSLISKFLRKIYSGQVKNSFGKSVENILQEKPSLFAQKTKRNIFCLQLKILFGQNVALDIINDFLRNWLKNFDEDQKWKKILRE